MSSAWELLTRSAPPPLRGPEEAASHRHAGPVEAQQSATHGEMNPCPDTAPACRRQRGRVGGELARVRPRPGGPVRSPAWITFVVDHHPAGRGFEEQVHEAAHQLAVGPTVVKRTLHKHRLSKVTDSVPKSASAHCPVRDRLGARLRERYREPAAVAPAR